MRYVQVSPRFSLEVSTSKVTQRSDSMIVRDFGDPRLPVEIFRDRMSGWFFDVASDLLRRHQDVAAVHVVTPLIEALEERYRGASSQGKSASFFKARAEKVLGLTDPDALKLLYGGLRCGFAHHGFLKDDTGEYNILLRRGLPAAVVYEDNILWIDPAKYVEAIQKSFDAFYDELSADPQKYDSFRLLWDKDWQMSLRVPGACGVIEVPPTPESEPRNTEN